MQSERTKLCEGCGGNGYRFKLPRHMNPFAMRIEAIVNASERVTCWDCRGTGQDAAAIDRAEAE